MHSGWISNIVSVGLTSALALALLSSPAGICLGSQAPCCCAEDACPIGGCSCCDPAPSAGSIDGDGCMGPAQSSGAAMSTSSLEIRPGTPVEVLLASSSPAAASQARNDNPPPPGSPEAPEPPPPRSLALNPHSA